MPAEGLMRLYINLTIMSRSTILAAVLAASLFSPDLTARAQGCCSQPEARAQGCCSQLEARAQGCCSQPVARAQGFCPQPVYLDASQPIEARVKDALSRMTVAEKVAMCHAQSKFTSAGCPRLGIPELSWSDGPHGVRAEINWNDWGYASWTSDSCTAFPALTCLAATWNPRMSALYGKSVGEEAAYRNKSVLLGPGVNIYRTPLNGRNFEYMGEDPYLASKLVVPYITALQANGVGASVKHYALNNQELWRGHIDVQVSERALREIYLPAFRAAAVEAKAWTFMCSYNKARGKWLCDNDYLLRKILKEEWQWDGVVVSDWGAVHSTVPAARAGMDVEMGSYTNGLTSEADGFGYDDYYLARPYREAIARGEVDMKVLDEQASRILRLIFRTSMNRNRAYGSLCTPEHYAAAREIAAEGIVLLKNSPWGKTRQALLPIADGQYRRILVVGENAVRNLSEGGGSSELKPKRVISPLMAIRERFGKSDVVYAEGYRSGASVYGREELYSDALYDSLRAEAVSAAKGADLIIYVGGLNKNWRQDCESGDRVSLSLPFSQDKLIEQLIATGKPVAGVFLTGNAFAMPWIKGMAAIVEAWYPGSEGGYAIADILSGDVNPSGRLPFSFPKRLEDNGAHSFDALTYPGDSIKEIYREDILVGYRWHDTKRIPALFPFGHGLSYTTYKYGKATVSAADGTWTVTVPVTNAGKRDGMETVQLYIGDDKASVLRPLKELKAFAKVALKAGETAPAVMTFNRDDLRFWDESINGWRLEPGTFTLYIGASSTDIRQKMKIRVE